MKKFLFGLILICGNLTWAGGDDIGNGGGLSEKNIYVAYNSIEFYSKLCLDFEACRLDANERKVLSAILNSMPQQRQSDKQIRFVSEKATPGFFKLNGEMKIAKTGSKIGDPIYINTDLLYTKNQFGGYDPLTISGALSVLLHEFGHHVSKMSHADLDLMSVKVSMFLQNRIQQTSLLPWNQSISLTVVQSAGVESFPQVLLNVGETMLDLSKAFYDTFYCPKLTIPIPILPFPDLQFGRGKPTGTFLHNVHWGKTTKEGVSGDFMIEGHLSHVCPDKKPRSFATVNSFRARLYFSVRSTPEDEHPILLQEKVQIRQEFEPWYKLIRFSP